MHLHPSMEISLLNRSNTLFNVLVPHGNLTLDIVNDFKLLGNDNLLNQALSTNVSSDFIRNILKISDIFQNPSIQQELNAFAYQTCVDNKCDYSFETSTCFPSKYI